MNIWQLMASMVVLVVGGVAQADRGAVSFDAGGAVAGLSLTPPVGAGPRVLGSVLEAEFGLRYAPKNWLELGGRGFWEEPANYYFNGTTLDTANGAFTGQAQSRTTAWGAGLDARLILGSVFRPFLGAGAGLVTRTYSGIDLINVGASGGPASYGLGLSSVKRTGLFVAPEVGLSWEVTDHLSLSLSAKAMLELTSGSPIQIIVPVNVCYSWYVL